MDGPAPAHVLRPADSPVEAGQSWRCRTYQHKDRKRVLFVIELGETKGHRRVARCKVTDGAGTKHEHTYWTPAEIPVRHFLSKDMYERIVE